MFKLVNMSAFFFIIVLIYFIVYHFIILVILFKKIYIIPHIYETLLPLFFYYSLDLKDRNKINVLAFKSLLKYYVVIVLTKIFFCFNYLFYMFFNKKINKNILLLIKEYNIDSFRIFLFLFVTLLDDLIRFFFKSIVVFFINKKIFFFILIYSNILTFIFLFFINIILFCLIEIINNLVVNKKKLLLDNRYLLNMSDLKKVIDISSVSYFINIVDLVNKFFLFFFKYLFFGYGIFDFFLNNLFAFYFVLLEFLKVIIIENVLFKSSLYKIIKFFLFYSIFF